ncbi:hypothetical protein AB0M87_25670 [Streptomyces sp. NPDC051320]|uniref:hypothetical protein n=1 Tax=Streptomyces sp. NPDC051320 TaxID=3154644 RepID=UPI0034480BFE
MQFVGDGPVALHAGRMTEHLELAAPPCTQRIGVRRIVTIADRRAADVGIPFPAGGGGRPPDDRRTWC